MFQNGFETGVGKRFAITLCAWPLETSGPRVSRAPRLFKWLPLYFPCAREGSVIRVGSYFSGVASVVTALGQMGLGNRVRVCVEFVCNSDKLPQLSHCSPQAYQRVQRRAGP